MVADVHHLVGAAEIGRMFGVSRQRVTQLIAHPTFPPPEVRLAMGSVWSREAVEAWAVSRGREIRQEESSP